MRNAPTLPIISLKDISILTLLTIELVPLILIVPAGSTTSTGTSEVVLTDMSVALTLEASRDVTVTFISNALSTSAITLLLVMFRNAWIVP